MLFHTFKAWPIILDIPGHLVTSTRSLVGIDLFNSGSEGLGVITEQGILRDTDKGH